MRRHHFAILLLSISACLPPQQPAPATKPAPAAEAPPRPAADIPADWPRPVAGEIIIDASKAAEVLREGDIVLTSEPIVYSPRAPSAPTIRLVHRNTSETKRLPDWTSSHRNWVLRDDLGNVYKPISINWGTVYTTMYPGQQNAVLVTFEPVVGKASRFEIVLELALRTKIHTLRFRFDR